MNRDIESVKDSHFDLVIIGGGIFGAFAALEASFSGLKTVLVEQSDFCHATSGNHFKMVHGGIRYLQHGDISRVRSSCAERSTLFRMAPHLVQPLPIIIPTYGVGIKSRPVLWLGAHLYDLLTYGANKGVIEENKIPPSRLFSKSRMLQLFPGIKDKGLTGGVMFHDGQMYNPNRLVIGTLRSAVANGVKVLNYCQAIDFVMDGDTVKGIHVLDKLSGCEFRINADFVLNAAGPWAKHILRKSIGIQINDATFSRDLAFVINRKPAHTHALAFASEVKDSDSIIDRGGRHLFYAPWRRYMLVGVWHKIFKDVPEKIVVTRHEIEAFIREFNNGYPGVKLKYDEILTVYTGLTLFGNEEDQKGGLSFGKRSLLIDHKACDGINGLITLVGVRATMAHEMAQDALQMIGKQKGLMSLKRDQSSRRCIHGGDFASLKELKVSVRQSLGPEYTSEQLDALIHNYGATFDNVLKYVQAGKQWSGCFKGTNVFKAEVLHAIEEEMACTLADVMFRRTELATSGDYSAETVQECAGLMADVLGWDAVRSAHEIETINGVMPTYCQQRFIGE